MKMTKNFILGLLSFVAVSFSTATSAHAYYAITCYSTAVDIAEHGGRVTYLGNGTYSASLGRNTYTLSVNKNGGCTATVNGELLFSEN